jgi:hypothetical protein
MGNIMQSLNNVKNQIILDIIMIPVSIYMTFEYYFLIMSGDDSIRRKIVLVVWALSIIGWSIKLVSDLKKRKT